MLPIGNYLIEKKCNGVIETPFNVRFFVHEQKHIMIFSLNLFAYRKKKLSVSHKHNECTNRYMVQRLRPCE